MKAMLQFVVLAAAVGLMLALTRLTRRDPRAGGRSDGSTDGGGWSSDPSASSGDAVACDSTSGDAACGDGGGGDGGGGGD